jgi:hypothetical protein
MRTVLLLIASLAWACEPRVEVPAGTIDGVNRTFEVEHTPAPDAPYFRVTVNGRGVRPEDYERDGKKIMFREGKQPKRNDDLIIYYRSGDNCR